MSRLVSLEAGMVYVGFMLLASVVLIPVREMLLEPVLGNLPAFAGQLALTCLAKASAVRYADIRGVRLPGWSRETVAVVIALAVLFSAESVAAFALWWR